LADGNTPSGRAGAGQTVSSTAPASTPAPASPARVVGATSGTAGIPTGGTSPVVDTSGSMEIGEGDFKKDGSLRAAKVKEIQERASGKSAERSFNEVTGKTTVTTTVGGHAVTFEEEGDTRGSERRSNANDGLARAFDRAVDADSEGV